MLLGLVTRMAKIENGRTKYNSPEFTRALVELDKDIHTSVNLSRRVGERNLMRNSSQYWKIFGLIPTNSHGIIKLTPLAKKIATGEVNQVDFAASMIVTFKLPNAVSYSVSEIRKWEQNDLVIRPFRLILSILRELCKSNVNDGWLSNDELYKIVVPMSGDKKSPKKIAEYILAYRDDNKIIEGWPNCVKRSNDKRFCGEYLRFLYNFGYLSKTEDGSRYVYIMELDYQIEELINGNWSENSAELLDLIQASDISSAVSMSSINRSNRRPGQQRFRHDLLEQVPKCPITGVDLPTVLQAAHIKPHAFGGPENVDNGLPLRADIHSLFDAGLLSIKPISEDRLCSIELANSQVEENYRELANKYFKLPSITNMEYVRWRYNNKLLGVIE